MSSIGGPSAPSGGGLRSSPSPLTNHGIRTGSGKSAALDGDDKALTAPVSLERQLPVVDRSKVDPEILKAAEGMEQMFLDYMMRVMRQTVPKNDMDLESPATEIYRGMLDSEYAEKAAHRGGIGLSDQIIAYLQAQRYNLPEGSQSPGNYGNPRKEKP